MHNPLKEQMDDWNVWAYELDFSVELVNSQATLIVGHNGSDDTWTHSDWGVTLKDFLTDLRNARSYPEENLIINTVLFLKS